MPPPAAIYTADNCNAAFQLNWAVSLFWREPPDGCGWLTELGEAAERDGVRILKHEFIKPGVSQFLASTRPDIAPERIVWSIKGRLQHAVRRERAKAFRRNYGLRSIGSATREAVEQYVRSQVAHHPMADPRVQAVLSEVQIDDPAVDLSAPRQSAHALSWYNLHVCFINDGRCMEVRREPLLRIRDTIVKAAAKHGHLLSKAGILPDHIHLALGCNVREPPDEVALSYMNNLAYALGIKRAFAFGYYVGTFGEYDLGVTWL
jgi:REP element-mobilizing transposase RayT